MEEKKVRELIKKLTKGEKVSYWQVLEKMYQSVDKDALSLSDGTSAYQAFDLYLKVIMYDIASHTSYRNYAVSLGDSMIRQALAKLESIKFGGTFYYDEESFCLTEGATGAVSSIFEYIKKLYPQAEVLFHSPNYYLFKYCADHYNVKYKEVPFPLSSETIPVDTLLSSISPDTKLIVIVNPHNPTGATYSEAALLAVIQAAKKHNILVLIDELFNDLLFSSENRIDSDVLAREAAAGENVILVKGFSKNKNLPGFRIGYVFSKNKALIQALGNIQEARVNFATASNYPSLILLDSVYVAIFKLSHYHKKMSLESIVTKVKELFREFPFVRDYDEEVLFKDYIKWLRHNGKMLSFYRDNYETVMRLFSPYLADKSATTSGFNTFLKLKDMEGVNMFDFSLNLCLQEGVVVHAGPYFGFDQLTWESNEDLGFWIRITFAKEFKKLENGINTVLSFSKRYSKDNGGFIYTGLQL